MSTNKQWSQRNWTFSQLVRVDEICSDFENAWNDHPRPTIEFVLAEHADLPQDQLLYELLTVELEMRRRDNEVPTQAEYVGRFPRQQAAIERAFERQAAISRQARLPDTEVYVGPEEPLSVNSQLGQYSVNKKLGNGGFGVVYLARDRAHNRDVALKVLHSSLLTSPDRRAEFKQEAITGANLEHPHLVKTYGIEEDGDRLFIVQKYIEGMNLTEWCELHQATPEQIVALLIPVARALAYLHENLYIHRDLKPANILVDMQGQPFVGDFGLALHEDEQRRRRGEFAGTRAYMSPEQVRGQAETIDGRSDIWSLGVILYHLLTDRLPFGGPPPRLRSDDWDTYYRDLYVEIQEHDPRPPRHVRPDLSRRLEEICLRCLEKRKKDRYQTGHDLAEDLLLYLEKSYPQAVPPAHRRNLRVIPKGLRSFDQADAEFFLELLPGPRTSAGIPASVAFWQQRLSGTGSLRPLEIGVLFGPSGSGKSSLVKAGILPLLGNEFTTVVVEATSTGTEQRLLKSLQQALPDLPRGESVEEACRWISGHDTHGGRRLLLVVDQFEQWLHGNPHVEQSELLDALRHCNGNRLQALLLARDDFWMPLSRAMAHLEVSLQEGNNAAAVDLFDKVHAHKVLLAFGRAYDRLPEADEQLTGEQRKFLRDAVDGLSDSGRIVCVRLAVFADMMKDRAWTPAELAAVGGAKGVGVTLLEEKFGPHAPPVCRPHREAVRRVLERFVPPDGTDLKGQPQKVDELRAAARYGRATDFDELIGILDGGLKLLTPHTPDVPLEADPQASDSASQVAPAYQLTHDFLVPTLREWLTSDLRRTRSGRAKLKLRERAEDWNRRPEPRRLPSLVEWLSIILLARGHRWNDAEQRLMKAATRRIGLRAAVLFIVAIVVAGAALVGFNVKRAHDFRNTLVQVRTVQVPALADEYTGIRFWAQHLLEQAFDREGPFERSWTEPTEAPAPEGRKELTDEQFQHLLNLGLVLGRDNPDRLSPILDRVARIAPEDLAVVARMLNQNSPAIVEDLGRRLEQTLQDRPSEVLHLATLLAEVNARDPRLELAAPELARQLRDARPTHFPIWLRHLARAARQLRPELVKLWQSESSADSSQRAQLAEALALYGADDAPTLVEAFQDAEPEEFAIFLPPLEGLGDDALPLFEQRIAEFQRAAKPPLLTFDGSAPSADLVKSVQAVEGHLNQLGGFALTVRRSELEKLCEQMAVEGYRPLAVRPHLSEQPSLASVTWIRDGREYRLEVDRSTEEFRKAIDDHLADGFHLVDVSRTTSEGAAIDAEPVWTGVWVRSSADEPDVRVVFDALPAPEPADGKADEPTSDEEQAGYVLTAQLERQDAKGQTRTTSLWVRLNPTEAERKGSATLIETADDFARSRPLKSYGDLYPGYLQTDLRVQVNAVTEKPKGSAVAGNDATAPPSADPPAAAMANEQPAVNFSAVWQSLPNGDRESRQYMDESLEEFLRQSQVRLDEGYLPLIIVPYPLPQSGGTRYASIWYRALPDPAEAIRNARRLANLAIALASRGHEQPLDDLLATTSPDRDPRTYAITRLAPAGFPISRLGEKLLAVRSTPEKYALLLALGEYPPQSVPTSVAWQPVAQQIASWSETAPEAAVRSAASWCARRLNPEPASSVEPNIAPLPSAEAVGQDEGPVARDGEKTEPLARGLDWYVNSQQHTMITLGPAEFRFGSPIRESDRDGTEVQIWVHIPRRYSLASTPVTVQQFERFWNDPNVRARIPEDFHKRISVNRLPLSAITWHVECPQTGLERLLAMMYCEWLSEIEKIPKEDRCYPEIWDYVTDPTAGGRMPAKQVETYGYLPRPNIVTRTGYRLPTEAEIEYACRAGTGESRHYGDSDTLLAHFAWYRDNSGGKFQPVALKMPNDFGFFDLLGNSSNYCHDLYIDNNPPPDSNRREDTGTLANRSGNYSQRGGDFDSRAGALRSSNRTLARHTNSHFTHGFRVAKTESTEPEGADSAAD